MCIFRRLYYDHCSHYQYLGPDPVRKCHIQLAYERGNLEIPCGKMFPHSYMSLKVDEHCKTCEAKISKAEGTLSLIRTQLAMAKLKLRVPPKVAAEARKETNGDEALSPIDLSFAVVVKGSSRGSLFVGRGE
ncbi:unnamed protein product [Discula destructiva]